VRGAAAAARMVSENPLAEVQGFREIRHESRRCGFAEFLARSNAAMTRRAVRKFTESIVNRARVTTNARRWNDSAGDRAVAYHDRENGSGGRKIFTKMAGGTADWRSFGKSDQAASRRRVSSAERSEGALLKDARSCLALPARRAISSRNDGSCAPSSSAEFAFDRSGEGAPFSLVPKSFALDDEEQ